MTNIPPPSQPPNSAPPPMDGGMYPQPGPQPGYVDMPGMTPPHGYDPTPYNDPTLYGGGWPTPVDPREAKRAAKAARKQEKQAAKEARKAAAAAKKSGEYPQAEGSKKPPRRKLRRGVGVVLTYLACIILGVASGWIIRDVWHGQFDADQSSTEFVQVPALSGEIGARMPDLRGVSKDQALTIVHDLGLDPNSVRIAPLPWAGTPDMVIAQSPAPGMEDLSKMTITVATPATVPDVIGKTRVEAINALKEVGAEAHIVETFDANLKANTVKLIDPEPGQPLGDAVTLTIAAPGSSVFLSAINSVTNSCSKDEVNLSGTTFSSSIVCSSDDDKGYSYEWDLGRKVDALEATVGIPDDERSAGGSVTVVVYADGNEVGRATAGFGQTAPLKATVTNALRLKIVVIGRQANSNSWSTPRAALGDARLIGTTANIDALTTKN